MTTILRFLRRLPTLTLLALGSVFYTGLFPYAPATVSTAALGFVLYLWSPDVLALRLLCAVVLVISVPVAFWMEGYYQHDPNECTIDEAAGYLLPLVLINLPMQGPRAVPILLAAFVLFRLFDILKPLGVRKLERLPGGWGIVLDDLGAGVQTWICLQVAIWLGWL